MGRNWRRIVDGAQHQADIGQVITLDAGGNVYVGGQLGFGCPGGQCDNRFAIVSYTPTGAQRFFGNVTYGGPALLAQVFSIVVLSDGSSALYGTYVGQGPFFAKFSATGVYEWRHNYITLVANEGTKMIRDRITGNFVIAGKRHKSGTLVDEAFVGVIKPDRTHERIWSYSSDIGFTPAKDLVQASDGNLIVIGDTSDDGASSMMFAAKMTSTGRQIGLDRYVTPGKMSNFAVAAAVDAADNAYVIGYTVNAQGGTEWVTIKYPSPPKIEKKPNGAMHLEFRTTPGQQYSLEASTNFLNWVSLVTTTADANGLVQFDDTNAPTIPHRFYRGSYFP
jgi:hypothetical protein